MGLLDARDLRTPENDHRYNDDLLLDEESRTHAKAEFPSIFHLLDDEVLRDAFLPIDAEAEEAKRGSLRAGFWAVVAAILSLAGASAAPIWYSLPEPWPMYIAITLAVLGLSAAVIGTVGVLYGRRKDKWLRSRLRTERLRQFHFQAFIWALPQIARSCDGTNASRQRFVMERGSAVKAFAYRLAGQADGELHAVLGPDGGARLWLYDAEGGFPHVPKGFDLASLFKAYRRLRFEEQVNYAAHKLTKASFPPRFSRAPLRNQQQILQVIWTLAFSALVALHAAFVIGYLIYSWRVEGPLFHVAIVALALVAFGVKTLEEGLGPSHEIERYEDYVAMVSDAMRRFDAAATTEEHLRAMIDMERISFDEMRSFLRTANKSSFVL